jgi:hypothetical protein
VFIIVPQSFEHFHFCCFKHWEKANIPFELGTEEPSPLSLSKDVNRQFCKGSDENSKWVTPSKEHCFVARSYFLFLYEPIC